MITHSNRKQIILFIVPTNNIITVSNLAKDAKSLIKETSVIVISRVTDDFKCRYDI